MISASRDSENINDFALVAMLGLLGLRIFEATRADIDAIGDVRGHRALRVHGKNDKIAFTDLCSEAAPESGWTGTAPPDG